MVLKNNPERTKTRIATLSILFAFSLTTFSGIIPTATAVPDEICVEDSEICFEVLADFKLALWTWTAVQGPQTDAVDVTLGSCPENAGVCYVKVESYAFPFSEFGASCSKSGISDDWRGTVNVWGGSRDCTGASGSSVNCVGAAAVVGETQGGMNHAGGQGSGVIDCIDE